MGMVQTYGASFVDEFLQVGTASQPGLQDFDGDLGVFVTMFPKVDVSKAPATQPTDQAIVTKLLAYTICMVAHRIIPSSHRNRVPGYSLIMPMKHGTTKVLPAQEKDSYLALDEDTRLWPESSHRGCGPVLTGDIVEEMRYMCQQGVCR